MKCSHLGKSNKSGIMGNGYDQQEKYKKHFSLEEVSIICQMPVINLVYGPQRPY